tara:strand:- start:22 stop:453 length:432 start_codon:yes stop_codon:yes gene_type:complete
MKNLILLLAIAISTTVNAQIEFPDGFTTKVDSIKNSSSGKRTTCKDGITYGYWGEFTPNDMISVVKECENFLSVNGIDFDNPTEDESSTYLDSDTSFMNASYTDLMLGAHVFKLWDITDSNEQKYTAWLMVEKTYIEFSITTK